VILRSKATLSIPLGRVEIARLEKFTPLACKPQNVGTLRGSREEIKHQVAELASQCWWMYLEGTVPNLFDIKDRDKTACGICYYFQIPENMDAGRTSTEFIYFNELTKKNLTIMKEREPDLAELSFDYETINLENEEIVRPKALISQQEFYNFLLAEQYNPKILYGGGSQNYIGDIHEFNSLLDTRKEKIKLRDVKTFSPTHLRDYSFLVNQETQEKITELGTKLYTQENSILYVIVAEQIDRNERIDARQLIESLGLNTQKNNYDAILIIIDLTGEIRLHAGQLQERRIKEHEITMLLQSSFQNIVNQRDLNLAITQLIEGLEQKLLSPRRYEELRIPQGTYYEYLSNDQTTAPIIENLMADRTYAIMYASVSDVYKWWHGIQDNQDLIIATTGAVLITTASVIISIKSAGAATPVATAATKAAWATRSVLLVKRIATVAKTIERGMALSALGYYVYLSATDQSFVDKFQALIGTLGSGKGDNSIYILPAAAVSQICDEA